MPKLTYNLADTSDDGNIPPGRYLAELKKVKVEISRSDNEMLKWKFEIVGGDYDGYEIKDYTTLQDQWLCFLKRYLVAFGLSGEVSIDDIKGLVGQHVCLIIGKREIVDKGTGGVIEVPYVMDVLPADEYKQPPDSKKHKGKK